ncbi:MAG: hypothetical protein QGD90_02945 [Candidatus Hydrogenedentes bacterium]|nr:hypothetical protein [Candidatus Hydrogenedentota bacterium]
MSLVSALVIGTLVFGVASQAAAQSKADEKRSKINTIAKKTLDRLFDDSPHSKKLYNKAYGYAVFDNIKISLMISAGGGKGVAVAKKSGTRTYMNMGTAGLNIGLGGQKYQVVFLFEDERTFNNFVEKGWEADANANAVFWKKGANAEASFRNGLAVYQLTGTGLMLQADIAGTKYWKNKKLNRG